MSNFKQKTVTTKNGKEYVLQHPGVRAATKITDRVKNKHGVPQDEKLADEMFTHVVVEPKVKIESFDNYGEMSELVGKAFLFLMGQDDEEDEGDDDQQE